jgi:hypothetical protein
LRRAQQRRVEGTGTQTAGNAENPGHGGSSLELDAPDLNALIWTRWIWIRR